MQITFATRTQAALWTEELTGQISDGMWENTPGTGWQHWCNADVRVDSNVGCSGYVPSKRGFAFNRLIPIVGDRMLSIARRVAGDAYSEQDLRRDLAAINRTLKLRSEGARVGYKLFRQRKDGSLGPLFINARQRVPLMAWLPAEDHPTKGYAHRPGWHILPEPSADHLRQGGDRVWARVEFQDYEPQRRPDHQGGTWYLAKRMRVLEVMPRA